MLATMVHRLIKCVFPIGLVTLGLYIRHLSVHLVSVQTVRKISLPSFCLR